MQTSTLEQSVVKLDGPWRQALHVRPGGSRARSAWPRKAGAREQLRGSTQQIQGLQAQQEKLVSSEKQHCVEDREILQQKESSRPGPPAAEAQRASGEQMADTGLAVQRAKDKTESDAGARDRRWTSSSMQGALENVATGGETDTLRPRAQGSSRPARKLDDELAKMKAEVGSGSAPKEIEK